MPKKKPAGSMGAYSVKRPKKKPKKKAAVPTVSQTVKRLKRMKARNKKSLSY